MSLEQITREQINKCQGINVLDSGNKVLYDLCSTNFTHDTTEKILAKTWLIGRAYAAAIERRKNKNKSEISDDFYTDIVVPTFEKSDLDIILADLKNYTEISSDSLPKIIDAHYYLTDFLFKITELRKRSFGSKYLHFHLPELFFIYDIRAVSAIQFYVKKLPKNLQVLADRENADNEYSNFFSNASFLGRKLTKSSRFY